MTQWDVLTEGLAFPEGPRFRHGELYLSDFYVHQVLAFDAAGNRRVVATVPEQPSGLGWLPNGDLLVVSMKDRCLVRQPAGASPDAPLELYAEISHLAPSLCNDMVVDEEGVAWVGNFGFDHREGEEPCKTVLVRVGTDRQARVAASDLFFPNGTVVIPPSMTGHTDRTLVVAESRGLCLAGFRMGADGGLYDRFVWADLGDVVPDGICLDAEGAIWVADPRGGAVVRVAEGGSVLERREIPKEPGEHRGAYACVLGGDDGRQLYVLTNASSGPETRDLLAGRVEVTTVDVPGAGSP